MTALHTIGLSLLQEIGFDIVSLWGQTGYLAKVVLVLFALVAIVTAVTLISKLLGSRR